MVWTTSPHSGYGLAVVYFKHSNGQDSKYNYLGCEVMQSYRRFGGKYYLYLPADGGSPFLSNDSRFLPEYTASQSERP